MESRVAATIVATAICGLLVTTSGCIFQPSGEEDDGIGGYTYGPFNATTAWFIQMNDNAEPNASHEEIVPYDVVDIELNDTILITDTVAGYLSCNTTYGPCCIVLVKGSVADEYNYFANYIALFIESAYPVWVGQTINIVTTFMQLRNSSGIGMKSFGVFAMGELFSYSETYAGIDLVLVPCETGKIAFEVESTRTDYSLESITVKLTYRGEIIDDFRLNNLTSANDCLHFTDTNSSGVFDVGDVLIVSIPPTESICVVERSYLTIVNSDGKIIFKLSIAMWYKGPFKVIDMNVVLPDF